MDDILKQQFAEAVENEQNEYLGKVCKLNREEERHAEYPGECFPDLAGALVSEYLEYANVPPAMAYGSALATMNLAAQGHVDVARDRVLTGPTSLNFLGVAESGERKTACDTFFKRPIKIWLEGYLSKNAANFQRMADAHKIWELRRIGLQERIKKPKKGEDAEELCREYERLGQEEPPLPQIPVVFYADCNAASLGDQLTGGFPIAAVWADEGAIFVGGDGMNREKIIGFVAMLNKLWDCGQYDNSRKTVRSINVNCRLMANVMLQESVFRELLSSKDGIAKGVGFLARFLLSCPESRQGYRPYQEPGVWKHREAFETRIQKMLNRELRYYSGVFSPKLLKLSPDAKRTWVAYYDETEALLRPGRALFDVKDFTSKTGENAARIAATFEFFENPDADSVSGVNMLKACELSQWYLFEARRLLSVLDRPQEEIDAEAVLEWLLKNRKDKDFKPVEVSQYGPSGIRNKKRRDQALSLLLESGAIIQTTQHKSIGRNVFKLHPNAGAAIFRK